MSFDANKIGLFRANPSANKENALKLKPVTGTGTPRVDSGDIDVSSSVSIEGIRYTGKDGVSRFLPFSNEDQLTQARVPYAISAQSTPLVIQTAIHDIIALHEIDSIVSVTKASDTLTVMHTGSGTVTDVLVDGVDVDLSRTNISTVGITATATKAKAKK